MAQLGPMAKCLWKFTNFPISSLVCKLLPFRWIFACLDGLSYMFSIEQTLLVTLITIPQHLMLISRHLLGSHRCQDGGHNHTIKACLHTSWFVWLQLLSWSFYLLCWPKGDNSLQPTHRDQFGMANSPWLIHQGPTHSGTFNNLI